MAALERCAAILLAAGLSRRFGPADKLLSDRGGRPLVDHAGETLASLPLARHVAVIRSGAPALRAILEARGFAIVENDRPEAGMAHSLALGIAAAGDADAALIALGDMPQVPAVHFAALCARVEGPHPVAASLGLDRVTVPAAFAAARFEALRALTGDHGAQGLLAGAATVAIDPALLADVDRQSAARRAHA